MTAEADLSRRIAAHIAGLTLDAVPPATHHATRRALLDAIGVMLGASGLGDDALPYRAHAAATPGPARLIGLDHRSTPALAALANGALAHALDYGDTFDAGPAHPHAALAPALLALADTRPEIDVGTLLTALAAGGDLACRLSLAPARPYEEGGWYPPPLVNLIAGAAACARLLGLEADGVRHAMGLALVQGAFPGIIKYDPTSPMRGMREAFVARASVEAALLAEAGARGFDAPLEGKAGFFEVYGGGAPGAALTNGLGERFLGAEVSFKPWPACRGTHPYIEAALALRDRINLAAIDRIEAETGPIQEMLIRPLDAKAAPTRPVEAKFSIPWTVGAALVHGVVTLDSFSLEALDDPQVRAVAARVVGRRNPGWGRAQAASGSLTIHLRDGTLLTHSVSQAAGHPDRPMTDSDLIAKFARCAAHAATPITGPEAEALAAHILGFPANNRAHGLLQHPACATAI